MNLFVHPGLYIMNLIMYSKFACQVQPFTDYKLLMYSVRRNCEREKVGITHWLGRSNWECVYLPLDPKTLNLSIPIIQKFHRKNQMMLERSVPGFSQPP